MSEYGVVLFHTTSAVLRAEKTLQKNNFVVKLIPTPREFSSDCGMALQFEWSQAERARALLEAARVEISAMHPMN